MSCHALIVTCPFLIYSVSTAPTHDSLSSSTHKSSYVGGEEQEAVQGSRDRVVLYLEMEVLDRVKYEKIACVVAYILDLIFIIPLYLS